MKLFFLFENVSDFHFNVVNGGVMIGGFIYYLLPAVSLPFYIFCLFNFSAKINKFISLKKKNFFGISTDVRTKSFL